MLKKSLNHIFIKNKKNYINIFFIVLFYVIILTSCQKKQYKLIESTGKINSLSVIIDDQLWNGEIGDSIRNKFASPIVGLPQEEPIFTINQYPIKLLEGFTTNNRNILLIKKENKSRFEIIENEYAKPQVVVHISGKTVQEIVDTLENNTNKIIKKIKQAEIKKVQAEIKKSLIKTKKISTKFGITIDIPKGYRFVTRKSKFIWLKKEIVSGSNSILIYQTPIFDLSKSKNRSQKILNTRDSISNLYIHGSLYSTKMVVQNKKPYTNKIILENKKTIESKGVWEMQNDNMSGPFINYTILDKKHNRIIVLDGFCYAPSKEKRDLMLELEAIIKSIKFL